MKQTLICKSMLIMPAILFSVNAGAHCTQVPSVDMPGAIDTIAPPPMAAPHIAEIINIIDGNSMPDSCSYDAEVNGIYYNLDETTLTASVTRTPKSAPRYSGAVSIPSSISRKGQTYTVTVIEENAFRGCEDVTSIAMPGTIDSIAATAFRKCSGLKELNLPASLRVIEEYAFDGCDDLTQIDIPASVEYIKPRAFTECVQLQNINVSEDNPHYCSAEGILIEKVSRELLLCPRGKEGEVTIPEMVNSIGEDAFADCSRITGVRIPNNVIWIGDRAFEGCTELQSLNLPSGLKYIGYYAFSKCSHITSVHIPASLNELPTNAFSECIGLREITVSPRNKEYSSIDGIVFNKGQYLLNIYPGGKDAPLYVIPSFVTSISMEAFCGNPYISEVTIPNSVSDISFETFRQCSSLRKVNMGNSIKTIYYGAFDGCSSLDSIYIPASVTEISYNAFRNCSNLRTITVDPANQSYSSIDGVLFDKTQETLCKFPAGWFNRKGKEVAEKDNRFDFPKKMTRIGKYAFAGCLGLSTLSTTKSVKAIDENAFYGCKNLYSVKITKSVKNIGEGAFSGCISLTSITIPKSTTVAKDAFNDNKNLTIVRK